MHQTTCTECSHRIQIVHAHRAMQQFTRVHTRIHTRTYIHARTWNSYSHMQQYTCTGCQFTHGIAAVTCAEYAHRLIHRSSYTYTTFMPTHPHDTHTNSYTYTESMHHHSTCTECTHEFIHPCANSPT
eukprot:Polyplicarium_translucidae@DN2558_c0_g1_i2.p3